jgi:hypothetical protein
MEANFKVVITILPIFHDKSQSQTSPEYIKVLIDNDVIQSSVKFYHKDIKNSLSEIFNEYIKINYEWPKKQLVGCRKKNNTIELIFSIIMPYFKDCNKKGRLLNITDFSGLISDEYYVECITGNGGEFE